MSRKPLIICVTGGKGGTGKTLVAVNLAVMFKNQNKKVLLVDGDVENPNTYLLFGAELEDKKEVLYFIPKIIEENCSKCGICAENCMSHALIHLDGQVPIPILPMCSGCQLCYKICPSDAIEADLKIMGWMYLTQWDGLSLLVGELKPGEAHSAVIVDHLLERLDKIIETNIDNYDIIILDTAPGAHCDVELLIGKADYVVPVTEPTRFGKLDLLRIIELIKIMGKDFRTIVNRSSLLGFKEEFLKQLKEENIIILGDIPLDDDIVSSYCQGRPLMDDNGDFNKEGAGYQSFQRVFKKLLNWIGEVE